MTTAEQTAAASTEVPVHPALAPALARQGYTALTPVQAAVLEDKANGSDLLVSAQTGSGKTVAFGLAIAPTLLGETGIAGPADRPLGLIIAPTRELALQVERELRWLYADAGAVTASCVGGMDMRKEIRQLDRGAHIVVGTPGRLRDHITKGSLDLSALRAVVLDEADEMLDMGFRDDLEFILAAAPEERRTLMFSATVPKQIAQLAQTYQRDALRIVATGARERHADIDYQLVLVQPHERENAIINTLLYYDSGSAIVFCHTREAVKHLAAQLGDRGFHVVSLSGELSQSERTNALQSMRDGRSRVCVATDVAARGIDLPNLDLVIHADLPSNPDTLLHRSGRTGRAGRKGVCVLIVPVRRYPAARRVLGFANAQGTVRNAPTAADIEMRYREQILAAATTATMPEEAEASFVAELLERVTPEQLAAAYLRQQLATRPAPEDISAAPLPGEGKGPRDEAAGRPRPERRDMTGAQWFSASVGRSRRAEPRWLLPLICKAGGITRDDVGSIKIFDDETRFEISADKAAEFAERVARIGSGEKGVTITPADGKPREARQDGPAPRKAWQTPRPEMEGTPDGGPAQAPAKPGKKAWPKGEFAKKKAFGEKPGKPAFKDRKPYAAKGTGKFKGKSKAPK
ncbi:ATP-dependent helicase [Aestuariivirga litoralis]|uniref:ATP-dependent helicase n=1 Tax=Aestuariivirga litoralis TaxID=2650924 RepID=A0A2W2CEK7_9HYPH|nr:DEAD/DEAH box helicase [Aestuariivirga litoralis]PZF78643.1 ATP-dependent helicase [Aestuariivirga litoralis]